MMAEFTLAACAEMIFTELPITKRVRRIDDLGFQVEIWDWTKHDIDSLRSTGATFSSMTGYVTGDLIDPDGAEELVATAEQSIPVAARLGIPRLNLHGTGLDTRVCPSSRSMCSPVICGSKPNTPWRGSRNSANARE